MQKVVIVGGVAGGATAAARIRRLDEHSQIIIFERSSYVSYANCGLPYYVGGVIEAPEDLTLQTPESFWQRFRVDVRVRHEVVKIDAARKIVTVHALDSGEIFEESYDKLLLSPGAKANVLELPGVDSKGIFTLRTVEDCFRLREQVKKQGASSALVIGGGFIGLEAAENLRHAGLAVTLIQHSDRILSTLDPDMSSAVAAKLRQNGIDIRFRTDVAAFTETEDGISAATADGCTLTADMVLLAVGVTPETQLAAGAGLALGSKGSIVVNEKMETSLPDIYAVGDAVEITQFVSGKKALVSLAGPANKQGRIAADNICGGDSRYSGAQGSSVIKLFDMTAAVTGLNERDAKAAGLDYDKVVLSPNSHATYYPGARTMTMKVLFEKETLRILGAQIVGYEGVDKRIDVLATAIRARMTGRDLAELELAYAPPYSSAKDPVNMAGYMICNLADGLVKQFHYDEVAALPRDGSVTLLDTRTVREYSRGHIEGFVNIPVDELRERIGEIPPGKSVYVICQSGLRSYIACRILSGHGFDCYNFSGGFGFYKTAVLDSPRNEKAAPCGMEK